MKRYKVTLDAGERQALSVLIAAGRAAGGRIDRQMEPGRDDVWVKPGPGQQPWHGIEDGMFAGSTVWLNWSDSAADP